MKATDVIEAKGHPNIRATHRTTFGVTKEEHVTPRGDCIIAVAASKSARELSPDLKQALRSPNVQVTIEIAAGEERETVRAQGSPELILDHPTDLVVRKSGYICGRTLAVKADKAAYDLSRSLVSRLGDPNQHITIAITVEA